MPAGAKIGLTYAANDGQINYMLRTRNGFLLENSNISGNGQADLLREMRELLDNDPLFYPLRGRIQILPFDTMQKFDENQCMEEGKRRLSGFMNSPQNVVFLWGTREAQTDHDFRFALGGGENSQFVNSVADVYIQKELRDFANMA